MTNSLYYGKDTEKIHETMLSVAREVLATDHLSHHPDFLEIAPADGKNSIGVDDIFPVITLSMQKPILSQDKSVAIINGMDLCTKAAQNKLLLTLESNKNVLILASAKNLDLCLDTIKSRMQKICFEKSTLAEYEKLFSQDAELIFWASNGDLSLANRCVEHLASIKSIKKCCEEETLSDLLPILHLVREKDPESFALDKTLMEISLHVIASILNKKAVEALSFGDKSKAHIQSTKAQMASMEGTKIYNSNYTKDDFFWGIVQLIES